MPIADSAVKLGFRWPVLARAGFTLPTETIEKRVAIAMEIPQIRPGRVSPVEKPIRVVAFFFNSAPGNSAIQLLTALGVPNEGLGVTPPERIDTNQGMILSVACDHEQMAAQVESVCRQLGANVHRQRR